MTLATGAATDSPGKASEGNAVPKASGGNAVTKASEGNAVPIPASTIRLRGLTKRFGARVALDRIDLDVEGPARIGVVGPDGAGKTTLLRALAGLLEVEAEVAEVLGHDLAGDVVELKRRVGYVPQSFSLYRDLTIAENLAFTGRLHRLDDAEFRRRRDALLERTALAPFAARKAGALSGGMKQKLAIANALLPSPSLLVLDEPTAGVDVVARAEIFEILDERRDEVLVVLSTSYLEEADTCDLLVYLHEGRIVATGSPAGLEASTGTQPWRAWTSRGGEVREAALALDWVAGARDCGRFVRIEVATAVAPGPEAVSRALHSLCDGAVDLAERAGADLESTLLALSRRTSAEPRRGSPAEMHGGGRGA